MRQKGESQTGSYKKRKHTTFSEKRKFLTPRYAHARVCIRGVRNALFRKIWRALFSCKTRFEIRPFALLPTNCPIRKVNNLVIHLLGLIVWL